jgi:flavin reductase (DIM6/NTAB) family NADH-FMN oxidoreductase RutF
VSIDEAFDRLVDPNDPAMVIVTTAVGERRSGCLVGFHSQASIEPRRYVVWISKVNHTAELARSAEHVAVHFLTDDDHDLAELFGGHTSDDIDKFERCDWSPGPGGVPLLTRCDRRLVGRAVARFSDGGDHMAVVLEPVSAETGAGDSSRPLRLHQVDDIDAGHPADEPPRIE